MTTIDMQKKRCPLPVISTRKELKTNPTQPVMTIVDNWIAVQNLEKLGTQMGYTTTIDTLATNLYHVTFATSEQPIIITPLAVEPTSVQGGTVIVFASQTMGKGDDTLGKILLKGYVYALTQLDTPPDHILLYNGGVHLSVMGADTLDDLLFLQTQGTVIASCGACLGHYELADKLAVGEVTNMYAIAEILSKAERIIKP